MGKKKSKERTLPAYSEQGAVTAKKRGAVNVALVYPNTYQAGMSNLGFQSVYALFNAHEHVVCHRFFLPAIKKKQSGHGRGRRRSPRERDLFLKAKKEDLTSTSDSLLTSVETGMPLSDYDIIAFSVSFENDYLNLISILKKNHIPLRSREERCFAPPYHYRGCGLISQSGTCGTFH